MATFRFARFALLGFVAACTVPGGTAGASDRPAPPPSDPEGVRGDGPVIWTWQEPLGAAASDGRFIRMVRVKCNRSPEVAADSIVQQIRNANLGPGEICVLLQNFGMGDGDPRVDPERGPALFTHWCDALPHRPRGPLASRPDCLPAAERDAAAAWWETPWMSHGIAESRAWMDRFIARYRQLQAADPRIPDPDRFHFDCEAHPTALRKSSPETFAAMMRDPRWATEPIPGHDGRTLADLHAAAGSPPLNVDRRHHHVVNRKWTSWYESLCLVASDAALDESAYRAVRAAWPNALSSNYGTSDRYDGEGTPRRTRLSPMYPWLEVSGRTFGDLQAPVYFGVDPNFAERGERYEDAAVRFATERVRAAAFSFGGPKDDIVPWILAPGQSVGRGADRRVASPQLFREMLVMLRAFGVDEVIAWSGSETQGGPNHWNAASRGADHAWSARLERATRGTAGGPSLRTDDLIRAWRDVATMSSQSAPGGGHEIRIDAAFSLSRGLPTDARRLRVDLAADLETYHDVRVELVPPAGSPIAFAEERAAGDWARRFAGPIAASAVHEDGTVRVRVRIRSNASFSLDVDLLQASFDDAASTAKASAAPPRAKSRTVVRRPKGR